MTGQKKCAVVSAIDREITFHGFLIDLHNPGADMGNCLFQLDLDSFPMASVLISLRVVYADRSSCVVNLNDEPAEKIISDYAVDCASKNELQRLQGAVTTVSLGS